MKIFDIALKGMLCLSFLTGIALFSGCKEDAQEQEEPVSETDFNLGRNVVEMSAEGGEASVPYFIDNPIEGMDLSVDYEADWLNGFDWSSGEEIVFNVEAMGLDDDFREAVVTVSYADIERTFSVSQTSGEDAFTLEIVRARPLSIWLSVEALDPDMKFWINIMETEKYKSYSSDQELFEADMEMWKQIAEAQGGTLNEFLLSQFEYTEYLSPYHMLIASYGRNYEAEYEVRPGVSYTAYCYGMNSKGERLSRIYEAEATTPDFTLTDGTEYDMSVSVNGSEITMAVTPSADVTYYREAVIYEDGNRPTAEEHLHQTQIQLDAVVFMTFSYPDNIAAGVTIDDVVAALCPPGEYEGGKTFNYSDMPGFAFVYTVDSEGNIISNAHTEDFRLDPPSLSDNQIVLDVTEIGVRNMKWSSTATNQDQYLVYNLKVESVKGMTDREILDSLAKDTEWYYNVHTGSVNEGTFMHLDRNTDYILVAFGYQNGAATTKLFKYEYTTLDEEWSDVVCTVDVEWFDGDEVMAMYPEYENYGASGQAFICLNAEVEGDCAAYYYRIFGSGTSLNGISVFDMSDDQFISMFDASGPAVVPTSSQFWPFDSKSIIVAVAKDSEGKFGKVFRKEIVFTEDGCSPIEELVL